MQQGIKNNVFPWVLSVLFALCIVGLSTTDSYAQYQVIAVANTSGGSAVPATLGEIIRGDNFSVCGYYIDAFGNTMPLTGFTSRVVNCILGTVSFATQNYLATFGNAFIATINVMAVFATILLGFYILSGRAQEVGRKTIILALKIGVVIWMINFGAFATLFPAVLYTTEWLVGLVTQYTNIPLGIGNQCPYSPFIWNRIDCVINLLIGGITPGTAITSGIIALSSGMLWASGIGVGIFLFILGILLGVLKTIFQAMYILLSAYIAIALLIVIAPMMIPLILFQATKGYFEKWLRLLVGVMLQPIFLFAYLTMFLIALEVAIFSGPFSIYRSIACNNANVAGFSIGEYIMGSGALGERSGVSSPFSADMTQNPQGFEGQSTGTTVQLGGPLGKEAVKIPPNTDKPFNSCDPSDPSTLANCSSINTGMRVMAAQISTLAANCDRMPPITYVVRLILSLFTAMALIYVFSTMLQFIPYLGTLISSGDRFSLPSLMKELPTDNLSKSKVAQKFGFIAKGNQ